MSFEEYLRVLEKLAEYVYKEERMSGSKKLFVFLKCMEESGHLTKILMDTHKIVLHKTFFD